MECDLTTYHPLRFYLRPEIVQASSLLPSNVKRSYIVHSLIQALGLLTLAETKEEHSGHAVLGSNEKHSVTRRIQVVAPVVATKEELLAYHDADFLECVLKGTRNAGLANSNEPLGDVSHFGLEDV